VGPKERVKGVAKIATQLVAVKILVNLTNLVPMFADFARNITQKRTCDFVPLSPWILYLWGFFYEK